MPVKKFDELVQDLTEEHYSQERLQPKPRDVYYLHLVDLRAALKSIETTAAVKLLDYGCGSSPYRSLFPNADYKRADFLDFEGRDYALRNDSRVPEADAQFDIVLSTQVLEHVPDPPLYLSECFRLLKPGGKLFLTTHGTFEDHGCPYDFHRWTADGLKLLFSKTGFENIRVRKHTTGPRAIIFLTDFTIQKFSYPHFSPARIILAIYKRLFLGFRAPIHRFCDRYFSRYVSADAEEPGHSLYICLSALAERPR